jgi:hypothetical protein
MSPGSNIDDVGEQATEVVRQPKSNTQKKRDRAVAKQEKHKAKKVKNATRDDQWTGEIDRQNPLFERYYRVRTIVYRTPLFNTDTSS